MWPDPLAPLLTGLDLLLHAFHSPFCLVLCGGTALAKLFDARGLRLGQVEPVDRLREAEVRVDARDDDPSVDRDELDSDDRDPDIGIDDEALVQDDVEYVCQPRRARGALQVVAARS